MFERLTINYQNKPCYDIVLTDTFKKLSDEIKSLNFYVQSRVKNVCIVTDSNVDFLYGEEVERIFTALGFDCTRFVFQAGEAHKTLNAVRDLYGHLTEKHFARNDLLVALGGGVVGDLCGYAAATYMRGISFVQIPTTLLSQVDSSIGGKTGVDFDGHKNMVGAFHMPKLVYINIAALKSLSEREYFNGFAEVMKHGLIKDASFYEWLLENMDEICDREPSILLEMIQNSLRLKKIFVEKDPYETGIRAILNFGHTIGHAIEKAKNFKLLHGECVALGAVAASFISWEKGFLKMEEYYEIRDMFVPFNLPISLQDVNPFEILANVKSDKKADGNVMRFVLLKKVGKAFIDSTVSEEEILKAIDAITLKGAWL